LHSTENGYIHKICISTKSITIVSDIFQYGTRLTKYKEQNIYLAVGLLGCDAVWTCRYIPTFWRNILPLSSALIMKTVCFTETSVSTYKSTRRHNPEDQHRHFHCRENLKSHKLCSPICKAGLITTLLTSFINKIIHKSMQCKSCQLCEQYNCHHHLRHLAVKELDHWLTRCSLNHSYGPLVNPFQPQSSVRTTH
jgi:hypothetical protein